MIDTLLQVRSVDQNTDCFNIGTGFEAIGRNEPEDYWDNQPYIYEVKLALNNSIFVGGGFNTYNRKPIRGSNNPVGASMLKIKQDGTVDTTFTNYGFGGNDFFGIRTIEEQSDGKIMVGGTFETYSGQSRNGICRLNASGTLDTTFNPGFGFYNVSNPPGNTCNDIEIQSDGKYIVGLQTGQMRYNNVAVNKAIRINTDGTQDTSFNASVLIFSGTVIYDVAIQTDGKVLCVGVIQNWPSDIVRLNTDGSYDTSFFSGITNTGAIYKVLQQSDGKIMIGGSFSYSGRNRIARLNSNGTLDTTFTSPFSSIDIVRDISIQSDGKYIVVGFDLLGSGSGVNVVRLNTNGSIDTTFNIVGNERDSASTFNGSAEISEILPNGDILVGNFATFNGLPVGGLVKLDTNGNLLNCVKSNNQFLDLYDDVSVNINMSSQRYKILHLKIQGSHNHSDYQVQKIIISFSTICLMLTQIT